MIGEQLARRREAACRLTPMRDGRRDPLDPRTSEHGGRRVLLIRDGTGPDRLVTSPSGHDVTELVRMIPREAVRRSKRIPGALLVPVKWLPDVEALARVENWVVRGWRP